MRNPTMPEVRQAIAQARALDGREETETFLLQAPTLLAQLVRILDLYVGHEPTLAEEAEYVRASLRAEAWNEVMSTDVMPTIRKAIGSFDFSFYGHDDINPDLDPGAEWVGDLAAAIAGAIGNNEDEEAESSGKGTPAGESTQPAPQTSAAELLALATVLEIPRPNTSIPFQLHLSHGHADRWAICDRTGRRWYRDLGWMYEPNDDRLCNAGRFTLAEAVPLAWEIAATEGEVSRG